MTLQQLRDLVAVITHGGHRSAARAPGRSRAGLTKSVARYAQAALLRKASRPLSREVQTLAAMLCSYARVAHGFSRSKDIILPAKEPAAAEAKGRGGR